MIEPSIADYAAIGDGHTLALVSRFGGLDWLCVPDFAGPSVFAALLDHERGGSYLVSPVGSSAGKQRYRSSTNIVDTVFESPSGTLELTDFMAGQDASSSPRTGPTLVRMARCTRGAVALQVCCQFRPGYGSEAITLTQSTPLTWLGTWQGGRSCLHTSHPLTLQGDDRLHAILTLQAGDTFEAVLRFEISADKASAGAQAPQWEAASASTLLAQTEQRWADWAGRCEYRGAWQGEVLRSALALKLLNYQPSGAIVAAGTTSIPEGPHGHRNWDYRYCWLRDTSLVLQALMDLGYTDESEAFLKWLLKAARRSQPRVQVLYDVHGNADIPERVVPGLRGYHGIGPVHVGNGAMHQRQLDIYGELLVTAYDFVSRGGTLTPQERGLLEGFIGVVCRLWREPDEGIWEIRSGKRHNTHSKVMCWAALDRGLRLQAQGVLSLDKAQVMTEREAIRAEVEQHGFDVALNSYVGYFGGRDVDASLLLMPRLGYLPYDDPRMLGTVAAIRRQLSVDGLLYRYPPGPGYDGLRGQENLFCICSFWLVECLARQGQRQEATALFERLLSLRNHVGLYAEEFEVGSLLPIGNFPQAFSHVGMITAALALTEDAVSPHRRSSPSLKT